MVKSRFDGVLVAGCYLLDICKLIADATPCGNTMQI